MSENTLILVTLIISAATVISIAIIQCCAYYQLKINLEYKEKTGNIDRNFVQNHVKKLDDALSVMKTKLDGVLNQGEKQSGNTHVTKADSLSNK